MDSTASLSSVAIAYPELMAAAVLLVGILIAVVARSLTERGLLMLTRLLARFTMERDLLFGERPIRVLKALVFWLIVAVSVAVALRTLGMGQVFTWLDTPLAYLPRILVGLLIIGAGYILGLLARHLFSRMPGSAGDNVVVLRLTQGAILAVALMTGLQHMGLDVSFIGHLLILLTAAGVGGMALAFALGAKQYVANLVAHPIVARHSPGDHIRINDIEGVIIEIHRTGVDLTTEEGVMTVPAALFAEYPVLRQIPSKEPEA